MSVQGLVSLFRPKSVAVIGASSRKGSLGSTVMRNLLRGDYEGPVMPVNPRHQSVLRVLCYPSIPDLPVTPELALICIPPEGVARAIGELGDKGCKVAIVLTVDPKGHDGGDAHDLGREILETARAKGMRVLGPGSTGVQVPDIGLNASWISHTALPGKLALVAQSGALVSGVLDWATARGIGFSHVVSAGDSLDINLGDILDYLALDTRTRAILLYIRSLDDSRQFMSAARAVARIKPVIAIKAHRRAEGSSYTPDADVPQELTDDVYDAAIRRAGILRVANTDELFNAVETLAYGRPLKGEKLAIVSNGGGPGEIAADTLIAGGGTLARLSEDTRKALRVIYSGPGIDDTPVDIGRDATPERFAKAVSVLLKAPDVDGLLVMHTPSPTAGAEETARAVARAAGNTYRNVLACWLGGSFSKEIHECFTTVKIPLYETPDKAARAFLHLLDYRRNQETLLQTPSAAPVTQVERWAPARDIVRQAWDQGVTCLDEELTAEVLKAYGMKVPPTRVADNMETALSKAEEIGFPVSLRLQSPTVKQKFTVGNVSMDLSGENSFVEAAKGIQDRFAARYPDDPFPGFVVQKSIRRPGCMVLMAGVAMDDLFGPVVRFGPGGLTRTVRNDHAVALPPLNMNLAGELISRTRVAKVLANAGEGSKVNEMVIRRALVQISDMLVDIAEIGALDINPLLVDNEGYDVIDARIGVRRKEEADRFLAIRPYPRELEETVRLKDGKDVMVRPVRPEDEPVYLEMLEKVSLEDLRLRFCGDIRSMPRSQLVQLIHIDYDREMAFVVMARDEDGNIECLGAINTMTKADNSESEYAILIRSDLKGMGLGRFLMNKMIDYCRSRNTGDIFGLVLRENEGMIGLTESLGFRTSLLDDEDMVEVRLNLQDRSYSNVANG